MDWVTILFLGLALAFVLWRTQSSRSSGLAPAEHRVDVPAGGLDAIEYYWRPGCPFCARLGSALDKAGIERNEHDIHEDSAAAATVRDITGGDETVPTVIVGPVALVNPTVKQVRKALAEHSPNLL